MSVGSHAEEFAGLPVREFDVEAGIEDAAGVAYRLFVDYDSETPFDEVLARFLEDPATDRVRALIIGSWQADDAGVGSEAIVEALVAGRDRLPALEALFLGDIISEENEISWIVQSDVTPLFDAFPGLREFRVRGGGGLEFGQVRHDRLETLIVETGGLDGAVVRGIAGSTLPALRHLELWLGTENYGASVTPDELNLLLAATGLPALRTLGLRNSDLADSVAEVVATSRSTLLDRIEVLDLSYGNLSDAGADLLAGCPAVARLKKLDIHHHYVSPEAVARLEALGIEVDADDRREADEYMGEVNRYNAVSE